MIQKLFAYPAIAWDFDGTLIGHKNSPLMHEFILAHPEKHHFIVTFRSHGMENTVFDELAEYNIGPDEDSFSGVINISNRAWNAFDRRNRERYYGKLKGPLTPEEQYYVTWKGMVCHARTIPVLVDDMRDLVLPGCEEFGIDYVHPDDL